MTRRLLPEVSQCPPASAPNPGTRWDKHGPLLPWTHRSDGFSLSPWILSVLFSTSNCWATSPCSLGHIPQVTHSSAGLGPSTTVVSRASLVPLPQSTSYASVNAGRAMSVLEEWLSSVLRVPCQAVFLLLLRGKKRMPPARNTHPQGPQTPTHTGASRPRTHGQGHTENTIHCAYLMRIHRTALQMGHLHPQTPVHARGMHRAEGPARLWSGRQTTLAYRSGSSWLHTTPASS